MPRLSLDRIEEAARTIDPVFRDSPLVAFPALSAALGAETCLKVETLNPIRCFKGRGADFFVRGLPDRTPLVAASAGNFGQGLAYAARTRGIPVTMFAAEGANPFKVARMQALGAELILGGADFDAAKTAARAFAAERGFRFVEDGRDVAISEGAGSIGVEMLRQAGSLDAVAVPLGNGALLAGIASWVKAKSPATRIVGVCAAGAPAMERSWRSGRIVATETTVTVADGIAVRVPVAEALSDMDGVVDDILVVADDFILAAMRLVLVHAGLVSEPAGAAGIAAILAHRSRFRGQRVATPLCGANATEAQINLFLGGNAPMRVREIGGIAESPGKAE